MALPLTRSGWSVVIGSFAAVAAGRVFAVNELFLLAAVALALVGLAVVVVLVRRPGLVVHRSIHPARVHHLGTSRVELHVTNPGRRSSPVVVLHDPVSGTVGATVSLAPIGRNEHRSATYRLPTERRGLVHVGPLEGLVTDPFGLARRRFAVTGEATLTVLPAIEELARNGTGGFDDPLVGAVHVVAGASADEDFATLRPYVVGDDLRRVHWTSSARTGDLLIRQDDPPWQGRQTIVLDTRHLGPDGKVRTDQEPFEQAVSAAASLVHAAATRNDRVRLLMADGTDTGTVDGRAARDLLLEHLALVAPDPGGRLPRATQPGRRHSGALTIVTTRLDEELGALAVGHQRDFASVVLVVISPEGGATAPGPADPLAVVPGASLVRVGPGQSFAAAWQSATRTPVRRR